MEEFERIDGATPDAWILTFSGRHIDFLHPVPDEIRIGDIARGLSRACRFAGQTRTFYSVAQHSVLASRIVPEAFALEALLHEALLFSMDPSLAALSRRPSRSRSVARSGRASISGQEGRSSISEK